MKTNEKKKSFSFNLYCSTTSIPDSAPDTSSNTRHTSQDGENVHIH